MRRECTARDAADEALITLPVPEVIVEVGNNECSSVMLDAGEVPFFSCYVDRYCLADDDQTSPWQVCINRNTPIRVRAGTKNSHPVGFLQ